MTTWVPCEPTLLWDLLFHFLYIDDSTPLDRLNTLINVLKPKYYHTDEWILDEGNHTVTRIHKRPRRSMLTPERSDCPVPLNRLNGTRVTHRDFGKGHVEVTEDVNYNQMKDPNQRSKKHWKGKTVFQLKLPVPSMTSRLAKTKPEPPKTELRLDTDGRTKKANDLK